MLRRCWIDRLTNSTVIATVLSSDKVESEGRQMKQCRIIYMKSGQNWLLIL
jgi:hypothetical protein